MAVYSYDQVRLWNALRPITSHDLRHMKFWNKVELGLKCEPSKQKGKLSMANLLANRLDKLLTGTMVLFGIVAIKLQVVALAESVFFPTGKSTLTDSLVAAAGIIAMENVSSPNFCWLSATPVSVLVQSQDWDEV